MPRMNVSAHPKEAHFVAITALVEQLQGIACSCSPSHNCEMEFMLLTRCASMALATNFDNSELQRLVVRILLRSPHAPRPRPSSLARPTSP